MHRLAPAIPGSAASGDSVGMNFADPASDTTAAPRLPDALRLGAVHLTVTDLDRSVAFYQDAIGLRQQRRDGDTAALGAGGEELVVLTERTDARRAGRHAGLYHYALLFDSREELSQVLLRLVATRTPIQGASDHGVSEAIYLPDPDGNGIELYADRPREVWPPPSAPGERVGMFTRALDLQPLLELADGPPQRHAGPGLTVGHVHLHVNDIAAAQRFYVDVLGLESMANLDSALFLAAGGYHHHLGVNVWRGAGIPAAPEPDAVAGLRHWTIVLASEAEVEAVRGRVSAAGIAVEERPGGFLVRDPANNPVLVTT
jgi:catechol 2,3-dioxygenase